MKYLLTSLLLLIGLTGLAQPPIIEGCTDPLALNFNPIAETPPSGLIVPGGSCNLISWNQNYFGISPEDYNAILHGGKQAPKFLYRVNNGL